MIIVFMIKFFHAHSIEWITLSLSISILLRQIINSLYSAALILGIEFFNSGLASASTTPRSVETLLIHFHKKYSKVNQVMPYDHFLPFSILALLLRLVFDTNECLTGPIFVTFLTLVRLLKQFPS